jgi:glutaminase
MAEEHLGVRSGPAEQQDPCAALSRHGSQCGAGFAGPAQWRARSGSAASCRDLALAGGFLARHGLRADGSRLLSSSDAKRINAVLLACGTYDDAGEFAYRVGLPGKSGVGGGVLAVVPGRGALCAWSPALDRAGNSLAAVGALDAFVTATGWSVF